jgi:hypothetical protein
MCLVWRQRRQGLQPAFSQVPVPAGELTGASGDQTRWQSQGDCWRKQDNDLQLCEQCKQHTSAGFAQRVAVVQDLCEQLNPTEGCFSSSGFVIILNRG